MKTLLLQPPQFESDMPPLPLAFLTAFLRDKGYDITQRDINSEAVHFILGEDLLKKSRENLKNQLESMESKSKLVKEEIPLYRFLSKVEMSADYIISKVQEAVTVLKNDHLSYPVIKAKKTIDQALRLGSIPYYPNLLTLTQMSGPQTWMSSKKIKETVNDEKHNPFRPVFKDHFAASIMEEGPGLIGILLSTWWQVVPGITLAAAVKEQDKDVHICLFGKIPTLWKDILPEKTELFQFFDSFITGESEKPFLHLIETIEQAKSLESVPNLVYKKGKEIKTNPPGERERFNSLPAPDFDGLPLDSYLSPGLVLPVASGRGCDWQKCNYCYYFDGPPRDYDSRDIDKTAADIAGLSRKYQTKNFMLMDEEISCLRLQQLSEKLLESGLDIKWTAGMRTRPVEEFTKDALQTMARSGCVAMSWGLEAVSQRVLDLMEKGVDIGKVPGILKDSHEAGIWNNIFVSFGFPSETKQEAEETLSFILKHADTIDAVSADIVWYYRNAPITKETGKFGVVVMGSPNEDLPVMIRAMCRMGINFFEAKQFLGTFSEKTRPVFARGELLSDFPTAYLLHYLGNMGYEKTKNTDIGAPGLAVEKIDDWERIKVIPKEDLFQKKLHFDLSDDKKASRKETEVLYCLSSVPDSFMTLKPNIKKFLDMSKEGKPFGEIIRTLSKEFDISYENARDAFLKLVKSLANKKLVTLERS